MNKILKVQITMFVMLGASFYVFLEPRFHPDSQGYIDYHSMRSVGYSFLIYLLKKNIAYVYLSQIILSIISCFFFLRILRKIFSINNLSFFFISFVLIIVSLNTSLNILSGSFSFSFYLIFLALCLTSLSEKKTFYFFLAFFPAIVSILIRPQLIFLIPSFLIFSFYSFYLTREKKLFLIFPIIFLLFYIPPKVNNYFNLKLNNVDVAITDTFNQLIILPLFVSNQDISNYFYDDDLKTLFYKSFQCAYSKELTKQQALKNRENWLYELETHSFPIKNCVNTTIDNFYSDQNQTFKEIQSKKLFFAAFSAHLKSDPLNLLNSYVDKYSSAFFNKYYLGIFVIFSFSILIYLVFFRSLQIFVILTFIISHYSNLLVICLGAPMLTRYKFYTEIVLILVFSSIIINFLNKKTYKNDKI